MERSQELFEKIERYLKGTLSPEENRDFERELTSNPDLRREVALHSFLETETKDISAIEFRRMLNRLRKKKKRPFRWGIAASFIVLIGTLGFFLLVSKVDNTDLFDKYYSVYPVEDVIRSSERSEIREIETAYADQKYDQVIPELKSLISKGTENGLLKVYLGNAQLQTGQIKEAIVVFQGIGTESAYYEDAQWYLALSHLKMDDTDQAMSILRYLVEYRGRHQTNAQSLLNELN